MTDLYEGINKKNQKKCIEIFEELSNMFNESDLLIKNYIVNAMFSFLMSVILQTEVKDKLYEAYDILE